MLRMLRFFFHVFGLKTIRYKLVNAENKQLFRASINYYEKSEDFFE